MGHPVLDFVFGSGALWLIMIIAFVWLAASSTPSLGGAKRLLARLRQRVTRRKPRTSDVTLWGERMAHLPHRPKNDH